MTWTFKPDTLLCLGAGYVAQHLMAALHTQGMETKGTHRTGPLAFDGMSVNPDLIPLIQNTSHLLISIPPDQEGDRVLACYSQILEHTQPTWVGYLSSTSVYGDHAGDWVDENTPCIPSSPLSTARLRAEQQWMDMFHQYDLPVHIFRLAGIYGPGRSLFDTLKKGQAIHVKKPDHVFSRIHVDDIVQVLQASMACPKPGEIYNVSDDLPASSSDVLTFACRIAGIECPPHMTFEDAPLSSLARHFYQDCKRVSNQKMVSHLGVSLHYPTYKVGLTEIWEKSQK